MKRLCLLLLAACVPAHDPEPPVVEVAPSMNAPAQRAGKAESKATPTSLGPLARETVAALAKRDMHRLAALVHPRRGVRFSPYAHVGEGDVTLRARELARAWTDPTPRLWGSYDGSGNPIQLTFPGYFERFVYDVDFAVAPQVAENRAIGSGNTINNLLEAYPGAAFVELHFPGFDPKYEGMDWRSLRLVYQRDGGRLWLVGIVHDQWTI